MDFFGKIFDDLYDYGADSVSSLWGSAKRLASESNLDRLLSGTGESIVDSLKPNAESILATLTGSGAKRPQTDPYADGVGPFAGPQNFQARRGSRAPAASIKALENEWLDRLSKFYSAQKLATATEVEVPRGSR